MLSSPRPVPSDKFLSPATCQFKKLTGDKLHAQQADRERIVCVVGLDVHYELNVVFNETGAHKPRLKGFNPAKMGPACPYNYTGKFITEAKYESVCNDPVELAKAIEEADPYDPLLYNKYDPRLVSKTVVIRDFGCKIPIDVADTEQLAKAVLNHYPDQYVAFLGEFVSNTFGANMRTFLTKMRDGYQQLLDKHADRDRLAWQAYLAVHGRDNTDHPDVTLNLDKGTQDALKSVTANGVVTATQVSPQIVYDLEPCLRQHIQTLTDMIDMCRGFATSERHALMMLWWINEQGRNNCDDLCLIENHETDYDKVKLVVPHNIHQVEYGKVSARKQLPPDMDPFIRKTYSSGIEPNFWETSDEYTLHQVPSVLYNVGKWMSKPTSGNSLPTLGPNAFFRWGWGHACTVSCVSNDYIMAGYLKYNKSGPSCDGIRATTVRPQGKGLIGSGTGQFVDRSEILKAATKKNNISVRESLGIEEDNRPTPLYRSSDTPLFRSTAETESNRQWALVTVQPDSRTLSEQSPWKRSDDPACYTGNVLNCHVKPYKLNETLPFHKHKAKLHVRTETYADYNLKGDLVFQLKLFGPTQIEHNGRRQRFTRRLAVVPAFEKATSVKNCSTRGIDSTGNVTYAYDALEDPNILRFDCVDCSKYDMDEWTDFTFRNTKFSGHQRQCLQLVAARDVIGTLLGGKLAYWCLENQRTMDDGEIGEQNTVSDLIAQVVKRTAQLASILDAGSEKEVEQLLTEFQITDKNSWFRDKVNGSLFPERDLSKDAKTLGVETALMKYSETALISDEIVGALLNKPGKQPVKQFSTQFCHPYLNAWETLTSQSPKTVDIDPFKAEWAYFHKEGMRANKNVAVRVLNELSKCLNPEHTFRGATTITGEQDDLFQPTIFQSPGDNRLLPYPYKKQNNNHKDALVDGDPIVHANSNAFVHLSFTETDKFMSDIKGKEEYLEYNFDPQYPNLFACLDASACLWKSRYYVNPAHCNRPDSDTTTDVDSMHYWCRTLVESFVAARETSELGENNSWDAQVKLNPRRAFPSSHIGSMCEESRKRYFPLIPVNDTMFDDLRKMRALDVMWGELTGYKLKHETPEGAWMPFAHAHRSQLLRNANIFDETYKCPPNPWCAHQGRGVGRVFHQSYHSAYYSDGFKAPNFDDWKRNVCSYSTGALRGEGPNRFYPFSQYGGTPVQADFVHHMIQKPTNDFEHRSKQLTQNRFGTTTPLRIGQQFDDKGYLQDMFQFQYRPFANISCEQRDMGPANAVFVSNFLAYARNHAILALASCNYGTEECSVPHAVRNLYRTYVDSYHCMGRSPDDDGVPMILGFVPTAVNNSDDRPVALYAGTLACVNTKLDLFCSKANANERICKNFKQVYLNDAASLFMKYTREHYVENLHNDNYRKAKMRRGADYSRHDFDKELIKLQDTYIRFLQETILGFAIESGADLHNVPIHLLEPRELEVSLVEEDDDLVGNDYLTSRTKELIKETDFGGRANLSKQQLAILNLCPYHERILGTLYLNQSTEIIDMDHVRKQIQKDTIHSNKKVWQKYLDALVSAAYSQKLLEVSGPVDLAFDISSIKDPLRESEHVARRMVTTQAQNSSSLSNSMRAQQMRNNTGPDSVLAMNKEDFARAIKTVKDKVEREYAKHNGTVPKSLILNSMRIPQHMKRVLKSDYE